MFDTLISARELEANLLSKDWVAVDCRYDLLDRSAGYRGYLEAHIPGAVYADLHEDLSRQPVTEHGRHPLPEPERMEQLFSTLGIANHCQVIVYDDSCGSVAARLWWMLKYMGHPAVAVIDGGWQAWLAAGHRVESDEYRNRPAQFHGVAGSQSRLVTLAEIPAQRLLVDARDPERYSGKYEPIDPVAGHIPGALNHCWKKNLKHDGSFREPHEIKQMLLELYAGNNPEDAVFYCGSGVTACHDILAAVYAGLPWPGLYAGSWSEWCSDTARPVATGDN